MFVKCIFGKQQRGSERDSAREEYNRYILFQCPLFRTSYQRGNSKLMYGGEMSPGEWVN